MTLQLASATVPKRGLKHDAPELRPWRALDAAARREFPGGFIGLAALVDGRRCRELSRFVFAPADAVDFLVAAALPQDGDKPPTLAVGRGPAWLRHGMPCIDPRRWFDLALRPCPASDRRDVRTRAERRDSAHRRHIIADGDHRAAWSARGLYETLDFADDAATAKAAVAAAEALYASYAVAWGSERVRRIWGPTPIGGRPVGDGPQRPALPRPYVRVVDEAADPANSDALFACVVAPGVAGKILTDALAEEFLEDFMRGLPVYAASDGRVTGRGDGFSLVAVDGAETRYQGVSCLIEGSPVRAGTRIGYLGPDMRKIRRSAPATRYRDAWAAALAWAGGQDGLDEIMAAWLQRQVVVTPEGPIMPADLVGTVRVLQPADGALCWEFSGLSRFWDDGLGGFLLPALALQDMPDRVSYREIDIRFLPPWRR